MRFIPTSTTTLGCGLVVYSLFTNYELGVLRLIPLKVHLLLDVIGGAVLIGLAVTFPTTPSRAIPSGRRSRPNTRPGKIPMTGDKPGKAEDVAELVLFLASERARHITDSPVWIDGGQSLLVG
jgi:hypothetical protein